MTPARQNTRLYSDFPHLPSYGVSIPHGEQCPAALPSIIDGNHPLGLPGHVAVYEKQLSMVELPMH